MASTLKPGDLVEWNTSQGTTRGTIKKKLIKPTHIKSHEVAASPDHPEYLVETNESHKEAAHLADEIRKVKDSHADRRA